MTIDERFERIEHVTGRLEALAEESCAADQRIESLVLAIGKVPNRLPGAEKN